jgi:DNA repair protein RecO (recombination protein O)
MLIVLSINLLKKSIFVSMIISSRGIVFRTLKYGETSLILDIYTEALGLRS